MPTYNIVSAYKHIKRSWPQKENLRIITTALFLYPSSWMKIARTA